MTLICAITDGKDTWLGSDTHSVLERGAGALRASYCGSKWAINGEWAYANTGDAVVSDLIAARFAYLTGDLTAATAALLFPARLQADIYEKLGLRPGYGEGEHAPVWGNQGLLATKGCVWAITQDMTCRPIPHLSLEASGSAAPWAIGAAWARQQGIAWTMQDIVHIALDAGIAFDMQIRGKWVTVL